MSQDHECLLFKTHWYIYALCVSLKPAYPAFTLCSKTLNVIFGVWCSAGPSLRERKAGRNSGPHFGHAGHFQLWAGKAENIIIVAYGSYTLLNFSNLIRLLHDTQCNMDLINFGTSRLMRVGCTITSFFTKSQVTAYNKCWYAKLSSRD